MSYISRNPLFRSLDDAEEAEFAQWARENPPAPLSGDWHVLHPVCRRVWLTQGIDLCPDDCAECLRDVIETR